MQRCHTCFNLEAYCTCATADNHELETLLVDAGAVILGESPKPELHTGLYL